MEEKFCYTLRQIHDLVVSAFKPKGDKEINQPYDVMLKAIEAEVGVINTALSSATGPFTAINVANNVLCCPVPTTGSEPLVYSVPSDNTVATITEAGVLTPLSAGEVVVTAKSEFSGLEVSFTVKIAAYSAV